LNSINSIGKDGRAGMCAVVLKDQQSFDFESLGKYLTQKLPSYSIPVFIRILPMFLSFFLSFL